MVGRVLTQNWGITERDGDAYRLKYFSQLTQSEINELIQLCEVKNYRVSGKTKGPMGRPTETLTTALDGILRLAMSSGRSDPMPRDSATRRRSRTGRTRVWPCTSIRRRSVANSTSRPGQAAAGPSGILEERAARIKRPGRAPYCY